MTHLHLTTADEWYRHPEARRCGSAPSQQKLRSGRVWIVCALGFAALMQGGCGGRSSSASPPIILSVSIADTVYNLTNDGSALLMAVIIVAPTETASLTVSGLPPGVTAIYKESESNPSGLLTLTGGPATVPGTYMPRVTVGSSGQLASTSFTLVVHDAALQ